MSRAEAELKVALARDVVWAGLRGGTSPEHSLEPAARHPRLPYAVGLAACYWKPLAPSIGLGPSHQLCCALRKLFLV